MHASAVEPGLELLIRGQAGNVHNRVGAVRPIGAVAARARYRARHQAAVVSPVEANPGHSLIRRLVLQVSGLIEILIVIDAEHRG